jgi:hypothetical protein
LFVLPHQWESQTIRVVLAGVGGSGSEMLDGLARIDRAIRGGARRSTRRYPAAPEEPDDGDWRLETLLIIDPGEP